MCKENIGAQIEGKPEGEPKEEKKYSQQELDEIIQRESDKRVSQALKTVERKNAEKMRESAKLAAMNEDQKRIYELEQREAAIAQKEKELALVENKSVASSILIEKGLSAKLVDFVVAEDADEMNEKIKLLDKEFKACVKAEVEKRLGSNAPKKTQADDALTKDAFKKMSLAEKQQLYKDSPEIYKSLI